MTCSNTFIFLGDDGGTVHMLKSEQKQTVQMQMTGCYHVSHPNGGTSSVTGMQYHGYTSITKDSAVLVTYRDSTVGIYKVLTKVGELILASE